MLLGALRRLMWVLHKHHNPQTGMGQPKKPSKWAASFRKRRWDAHLCWILFFGISRQDLWMTLADSICGQDSWIGYVEKTHGQDL